jgi:hypothetical protein
MPKAGPTIKAFVGDPIPAGSTPLPEIAGVFDSLANVFGSLDAINNLAESGLMREVMRNMCRHYSQIAEEKGI